MKISKSLAILVISSLSTSSICLGQNYVTQFGDYGWYADDTRDGSLPGTANGLLSSQYTHAAYLTGSGPYDDSEAIAARISWMTPGFGSPGNLGALKLSTLTPSPKVSNGKATLSIISPATGFAATSVLKNSNFYGSLSYYNPTERQVALRLDIKSSSWNLSQNNYTPTITGEGTWDLALVYVGSWIGEWSTDNINFNTGLWSVYSQSNNAYFTGLPERKTLAQLAADSKWSNILFGEGSIITNIQLGVGSSSKNIDGYASSLQLSFLNEGRPFEFVDSNNFQQVTEVAESYSGNTSKVYQVEGEAGSPTDTVSISNTGSADTETVFSIQTSGTLTVDTLTVEAGGVLTGSGVVNGNVTIAGGTLKGANNIVGNTTVAAGSTHAPGFSPAVVYSEGEYLISDSTLAIEIGGTQEATGPLESLTTGGFDQLVFALNATIGDGTLIQISQWNGFTLTGGETFNILYADNITLGENVTIVGLGAFATFQFELTVLEDQVFNGGTFDALQVTAVPEPSTMATAGLAALGLGVLLYRRRRSQP